MVVALPPPAWTWPAASRDCQFLFINILRDPCAILALGVGRQVSVMSVCT